LAFNVDDCEELPHILNQFEIQTQLIRVVLMEGPAQWALTQFVEVNVELLERQLAIRTHIHILELRHKFILIRWHNNISMGTSQRRPPIKQKCPPTKHVTTCSAGNSDAKPTQELLTRARAQEEGPRGKTHIVDVAAPTARLGGIVPAQHAAYFGL
jgi:hypothetical protein